MEELKQCRMQQRNIATTIDKLTHCLPGNTNVTLPCGKKINQTLICLMSLIPAVLEMYSRLQEQMKAKR